MSTAWLPVVVNDRYRLIGKLGDGATGQVLLAEDLLHDKRLIALKALTRAGGGDSLSLFKHEFRALKDLRHANLAEVYDFGAINSLDAVDAGPPDLPLRSSFFTMEYVAGEDFLAGTSGLPFDALCDLVAQVCRGLEFIHSRGLVHYDVKPSNLRVQKTGQVKLLDFGLAGAGMKEGESRLRGTVSYMAPELFRGERVDKRADLYSLGVLVYQAVARRLPFDGDSIVAVMRQHLDRAPDPPRRFRPDLPKGIEDVILRLLEKDPRNRFAGASQVVASLDAATGQRHEVEAQAAGASWVLSPALIGRGDEHARLSRALDEHVLSVRGDRAPATSAVVLVTGEKGIGKRRLLAGLKTHAQLSEVEVLSAGCVEHAGRPLAPFVEVLRSLVPVVSRDQAFLDRYVREVSIVAPELVPSAVAAGADIEPERDKVRLLGKLGELFVEVARRKPYVLCLSDLQWADEMSVELLRYLARHLRQLGQKAGEAAPARDEAALAGFEDFFIVGEAAAMPPLLVVGSCASDQAVGRPIEHAIQELAKEGAVEEVRLAPLAPAEVGALLSSMLGQAAPQALADRISEATGGNPLYAEETVKGLAEEGVIRLDGGTLRVDESRLRAASGGVRELVTARLARLDRGAARTLRVLSFFRGEASLEALRSVAGNEEELLDGLSRLESRGLVARTVRDRAAWYRVAHGIVREAVLPRVAEEEAKELHDAIGSLSEAGGEEEAAFHFSRGRRPERAIDPCLVAAERARKTHANAKAIELYTLALSLLPQGDPRRLDAKEALAGMQALVGQYSSAVHTYGELTREVPKDDPERSVRLYRLAAETFSKKGDWEAATKWIEEGLAQWKERRSAEVARLLYQKAWVSVQRGDCQRGVELAHEALTLAAALASDEITASLLNVLGVAHLHLCKYHQAAEFLQRALSIHERLGNLQGVGDCLNNLAAMYGYVGDLPKALDQQRRVLALREKIGDIWGVVLCLSNLGVLYHEMGDNNTAMEFYRRGLEVREKIGMVHGMANSLLNIGNIHHERGQVGETIRCWDRALSIYNAQGDMQGQTLALVNLAGVFVHVGALEKAEEYADRANYLANKLKLSREQASVARILAGIARGRKDLDAAMRHLARATAIAQEMGFKNDLAQLSLMRAEVLYEQGDADGAERGCDALLVPSEEARRPSVMTGAHLLKARAGRDEAGRLRHLDAALKFAQEAESADLQWEVHASFGRFYHDLKDYTNAGRFYKRGMEILRELWATVPEEHRDAFLNVERRQRLRGDVQRLKRDVSAPAHPTEGDPQAGLHGEIDTGPAIEGGDTATTRRRLSAAVQLLKDENRNLQRLIEINKKLNSELDLKRLLDFIMDAAIELTKAQRGYVILMDTKGALTFEAARDVEKAMVERPEREVSKGIAERVARTGEAVLSSDASRDERFRMLDSVHDLQLQSVLCVPLRVKEHILGSLYIENRAERAVFSERDKELLEAFADQAAIAVENARLYLENLDRQKELERSKGHVEQLNTQLSHLNTKLEEKVQAQGVELAEVKEVLEDKLRELTVKYNYDNIIARSPKMREVFMLLDRVTDSNLTVLIQGESGTGKELVAKAIHFNGPRKAKTFGAENCAALSDTLLESELFGYMRGAFTGAERDKKGLFELAHGGTLFLDEVGDMSVEMQKKLLRVLETGELRRVGGKDTLKVDVRVISASNKDLKKLVEKQQFREDLYYRLNVFTVVLPPLRDRKEDVPLLVEHFLREFAKEVKQGPKKVDRAAMAMLMEHSWPGNVRELRNVVMGVASLSDKEVLGVDDFVDKLPTMEKRRKEPAILEPLSVEDYMKRFILTNQGTMTDTQMAKVLGISRKTLWEKRKKWNLVK